MVIDQENMVEKQTPYITIALAAIIIIAVGIVIYTSLPQDTTETQNPIGDDPQENENQTQDTVILTLFYNNEETTYTIDELQSLGPITGYGGYRTNFPSFKGQGTYTGISITTLVETVAGSIENYTLNVTANEEGILESVMYNYSVIQGNVDIYNASNITSPVGTGGVTMILCYQSDKEFLDPEQDGNLKIGFINQEEEKITPAYLWWKFVESMEIIEE